MQIGSSVLQMWAVNKFFELPVQCAQFTSTGCTWWCSSLNNTPWSANAVRTRCDLRSIRRRYCCSDTANLSRNRHFNTIDIPHFSAYFNPLIATLKPLSNGPSYSNRTVIGTLTADGWAVFWYSEQGTGRSRSPPRPLLAVPNVTAHPSTASAPTSYYSM